MKRVVLALTISLLTFAIPAYAQQQVLSKPTLPPELTFKITPAEADIIWRGLRELPVKDVEQLMGKIRQEVVDQTTPKPDANKEPAKEPGPKK